MLREARIAKEEKERRKKEREHKEEINNDIVVIPSPMVSADDHDNDDDDDNDDPLIALEVKLKKFITDQLTLVEERFETKLNSLVKRLDNLESLSNNK